MGSLERRDGEKKGGEEEMRSGGEYTIVCT